MRVSVSVTETIETSLAQLAAANGQEGLEKLLGKINDSAGVQSLQADTPPKGSELLEAVRADIRGGKPDWAQWDYGSGDIAIVFMDDRRVHYTDSNPRLDDWGTAAMFGVWSWSKHSQATTPEQIKAEAAYRWIEPRHPRDIEYIARHMEEASGLFCRQVRNGIEPWVLRQIAVNFARIFKRPVAWFYDDDIPLKTTREYREDFEGLPVKFFDEGQRLKDAVWQFAKSLSGGAAPTCQQICQDKRGA